MFEQQTVLQPQLERRECERYPVDEDGSCQLSATVGTDSRPAKVGNISTKGIQLIFDHPFLPGTLLSIGLSNTLQRFTCGRTMRVVYVLERDDGMYVVGGEFTTELGHDELQNLLT